MWLALLMAVVMTTGSQSLLALGTKTKLRGGGREERRARKESAQSWWALAGEGSIPLTLIQPLGSAGEHGGCLHIVYSAH